ncbi:MAG: PAS domain S-box protein [Candidatus Contendobacter sp.]|nr:MAG: PAS domain S-box protein [Candidatus Contendobacter sp.]
MASSWWSSKVMPSARPLRLWLALRIALAGIAPLAVVAALVAGVLLPQLRADLEIRYQALARAVAGQIEAHLLGAGRELRAVAEYFRSRGYRPAPFWFDPLDAHAGTGDVFAAIYIVETNDSVYAVGLPQARRGQRDNLLGLDLSKWTVLREARERNEAMWSETFLSAVTGRLAVTLAIPVAGQVLVGEIAIDRLSAFIGRSPAESGVLTMILDRQGQIIAHSQVALSGQQLNFGHLPIVRDALQGRLATRSFELDGEMFVGAPVSIPQLGWIVLVAQPRIEAFRPLLSTLWALAAGALVALSLAILVAWALARSLARRIGRYATQAHAIADGDYDQPWPVSHIREFDRLAGDLERMALAIRQRERDLATSEARYRSVISNAPVVIFQFDEQGVLTLNEGKGLTHVGLVAGATVGHSLFELYHNYPQVCECIRRAIAGKPLQFIMKTRNTVYDVFLNPVRNNNGSVQVMGVAVDITEHQQAEEALRRGNRQLRMLSDCSQALIRVTDEIELLTTVCAIAVQEGGYRMAWVGYAEHDEFKTVRPMAHAGFEQGYLQSASITWADNVRGRGPIGAAIRTGRPCLIQNIASDPRMTSRRVEAAKRGYVAVCALPLTNGDRIFGALGIYSSAPDAFDTEEINLLSELASDLAFGITVLRTRIERERAEMALRENEHKYRELVENANSIILRWNPCGEITFINEFGLNLFGYSKEELVGQPVVGTIVPLDESTGRNLRPLMEDICLYPERFEHNINENIHRNGARLWIDWTNKAVLDERGQVVEIFSVGSDVTDRKRAEEELERHREHLEERVTERTAELRQAMRQLVQAEKLAALGHLVAGVAHELNTPLGNARLVASTLSDELRAFAAAVDAGALRRSQVDTFLNRGREAVDLLERNTARAADLIGHFKQVAVDQTSARRRRFDLRQTVEELLAALQPQFKRTAHRIALDIPPGLELDSYPGPLEQVLANLVGNSLAHGFAGVEAGRIQLRAQALDPTQLILRYADNGIGIPPAILNRIFEPFFTTRLGQGGSGLGLYIVYNLVTGVLGGTIRVHSQPGQGTVFTLALPRTAPDY